MSTLIIENGNRFWKNEAGQLHRTDGPAIEFANGNKEWYIDGICHREDGPAVEWADGSLFWYLHGNCHRKDGPAVEWAYCDREWWVYGIRFNRYDYLSHLVQHRLKLHLLTRVLPTGAEGLVDKYVM